MLLVSELTTTTKSVVDPDTNVEHPYYIHVRVEARTELRGMGPRQVPGFTAILRDCSGYFKVAAFHDIARNANPKMKIGATLRITNLKIKDNKFPSNYTGHKCEGTLQQFSCVEPKADGALQQMDFAPLMLPARNFFLQARRNDELQDENAKYNRITYDILGLAFCWNEVPVSFIDKKTKAPVTKKKLEVWITDGDNTIMLSLWENAVDEFKNLFSASWQKKLDAGICSIREADAKKLAIVVRTTMIDFYQKIFLTLRTGYELLPGYVTPAIAEKLPIKTLDVPNYSKSFLRCDLSSDFVVEIATALDYDWTGSFMVRGVLDLKNLPSNISYEGRPLEEGEKIRYSVVKQLDGRYFCPATGQYFATPEIYYKLPIQVRDCNNPDLSMEMLFFEDEALVIMENTLAETVIAMREKKEDKYDEIVLRHQGKEVLLVVRAELENAAIAIEDGGAIQYRVEEMRMD